MEDDRNRDVQRYLLAAIESLKASQVTPDPVMQRRTRVRAAAAFRRAADALDDNGRLEE